MTPGPRLALALAVPWLASCADATQLVVQVDSDLAVPGEMAALEVTVQAGTGAAHLAHTLPLAAPDAAPVPGGHRLPLSFGVLPPGGDTDAEVTVEVVGVLAGGARVIRRARAGFVEGRSLLLAMFLARSCASRHCPEDQTCTERGCEAEAVDPASLPEVPPGRELRLDAGTARWADAGVTIPDRGGVHRGDARPGQAGTDASSPDRRDAGTAPADAGTAPIDAGILDSGPVAPADDAAIDPPDAIARADAGGGVDAGQLAGADETADGGLPGFVLVPAGQLTMGSPPAEIGRGSGEAEHTVIISRSFWLGRTPVTQAQWRSVMGTRPWRWGSCGSDCPVENVSWEMAVEYLNALSRRQGLPPCYAWSGGWTSTAPDCGGFRLPTEAEWEHAARAGTGSAFFSGDLVNPGCAPEDPVLAPAGWYCGNSGGGLQPTARKQPNAWGLYDVHGGVWEWVHGAPRAYVAGAVVSDPAGPAGRSASYRGGSFVATSEHCRSAARGASTGITRRFVDVGFRAARTWFP